MLERRLVLAARVWDVTGVSFLTAVKDTRTPLLREGGVDAT
jgi:hypothetical protein